MEGEVGALTGSRKRWCYQVAFVIARFLVVGSRRGAPCQGEGRRREAVLCLGGSGEQPSRMRDSGQQRSWWRRARRE
jgi:hypothetical protein